MPQQMASQYIIICSAAKGLILLLTQYFGQRSLNSQEKKKTCLKPVQNGGTVTL